MSKVYTEFLNILSIRIDDRLPRARQQSIRVCSYTCHKFQALVKAEKNHFQRTSSLRGAAAGEGRNREKLRRL